MPQLRHVFLAPYGGDPTVGPDFAAVLPYGVVELVQPDAGALYPPPPADAVLVYVFSQEQIEDVDVLAALKDEYTYIDSVLMPDPPEPIVEVDPFA